MKAEKVRAWFKENWMYVAGGVATGAVIVLGVIKGIKSGDSTGNLITIDKTKDDWMDQLKSKRSVNGTELTVRQALAVGDLFNYIRGNLVDDGILTEEMRAKFGAEFKDKFPSDAEIIGTIN